jgi:hypothetical protein
LHESKINEYEIEVRFLDVNIVLKFKDECWTDMNDFDKRKLILDQLKWLAVYMGIAFVIAILLPFPVDWIVALSVFLLLSSYRRKLLIKKLDTHHKDKFATTNLKGIKEFFRFIFHNPLTHSGDSYRRVKYFCMKCGKEHNEISCPNCGSKMKRVG